MMRKQIRSFILAVTLCVGIAPTFARDGDAIAIVNGSPVTRQRFIELLSEAHGLDLIQQLILLDVARQETRRRNFTVTAGDIDREFQDTVDELARQAGLTGATGTQANKEKALQTMLDNKRLSMTEFKLGMERNAHLRKLAEADIQISEPMLRAEFARVYGQRRVIRHIQLSTRDGEAINNVLNLLQGGAEFADVARKHSKHADAADGGLMQPFSFDDKDIPPAMREAAFTLTPGDISAPVVVDQFVQIMKVEQVLDPQNIRFEDVRDTLVVGIRDRAIQQEMQRQQIKLYEAAKITILDRELKTRYDDFQKSRQTPPK